MSGHEKSRWFSYRKCKDSESEYKDVCVNVFFLMPIAMQGEINLTMFCSKCDVVSVSITLIYIFKIKKKCLLTTQQLTELHRHTQLKCSEPAINLFFFFM